MTEQLTLENFWNDAKARWPNATGNFCVWIDAYKEKHDWSRLFDFKYNGGGPVMRYKYHELPGAMQMGIFIEWVNSVWSDPFFGNTRDFRRTATEWLRYLDNRL
jgi:hypothetical protein